MKDKTEQCILELLRPIGFGFGIGMTASSCVIEPYYMAIGYGMAGAFSFLMCVLAEIQIRMRKKIKIRDIEEKVRCQLYK